MKGSPAKSGMKLNGPGRLKISEAPAYTTKALSPKTWPDFEYLFSQKNGWDHCWCMHFHRPHRLPRNQWLPTRAARGIRNRQQKKELVERGSAHGILVYARRVPVGWCQYGTREELPRIDSLRNYQGLNPAGATQKLWRITCFAVLKNYRQRGVARAALKAALQAIRRKGGGLVEAYPITRWESYAFGNESTHGTASMFEKEGFKVEAPLGGTRYSTHVLMRRTV